MTMRWYKVAQKGRAANSQTHHKANNERNRLVSDQRNLSFALLFIHFIINILRLYHYT
jgi:hypothetical protein